MAFTATAADGREIGYTDAKRHLWLLSFVMPALPALTVAGFVASGGNLLFCFVPFLFVYGAIPLLDALVGEDLNNPPEEIVPAMAEDKFYRRLVILTVPVFWVSLIATAWMIGSYELPWWAIAALAVGVGSTSGAAILVGHELGHKHSAFDRQMAKFCNAVIGYGHFCIEHNRGHHVYVSTPDDPASARMGETIYAFVRREIPGTFKRGWEQETLRLSRRGKSAWSVENEILQGYAITLVAGVTLTVLFGWAIVPFLVVHHMMGYYGLTQANYIEHYGLMRQKRANGRYEACEPRHSWNTNHIVSNLLTFHLQRHSDHHANPQRPYQALRNFEDLPRLPSGYPGCYALAAIPPLWFKIMDKKVMAWADGDIELVNLDPRRADELRARYAKKPALLAA